MCRDTKKAALELWVEVNKATDALSKASLVIFESRESCVTLKNGMAPILKHLYTAHKRANTHLSLALMIADNGENGPEVQEMERLTAESNALRNRVIAALIDLQARPDWDGVFPDSVTPCN